MLKNKIIDEVRWGMIGCGNVTELKSGPAFNKVPHSKLVAVMRRNAELAKDYALRHHVPKFYSDATDLINDPDVNAVYIATPPDTHAHYAIRAMQAGKAVYVEKPMARTYAECLEMIKVSEETNQPLYVAYYRRTLPVFLKVKELIESDAIGKPLSVNIKLHKAFGERDCFVDKQTWHVKPKIAGAGHLFDLASHQFDYLDFLFGPVIEVEGRATTIAAYYDAEDTVEASFSFDSKIKGNGSWNFVCNPKDEMDEIEIIGSKGRIKFPCFDKRDIELITPNSSTKMSFENPENISYFLVQQVVGAFLGSKECASTMHSAARTSKVLDEIVKSYYECT